eukprot:symbB.v1.2.024905.t1/scaffold2390.1/size80330/4
MPFATAMVGSQLQQAEKISDLEQKKLGDCTPGNENIPMELVPETTISGTESTSATMVDQQVETQNEATEKAQGAKDVAETSASGEAEQVEALESEAPDAEAKGAQSVAARRRPLHRRILAELAKSSVEDVRQRLEAELLEHDQRIAAAKAVEDEKQKLVDEAAAEVASLSISVEEATQVEVKAIQQVKDIRQKKKEASKNSALKRKELQSYEDMLVLLGFEKEKFRKLKEEEESLKGEESAKRQKIEELLRIVEESKKAQEELKNREKEARQQMRNLEKEQRKLARLGPFSRRQAASAKAVESKTLTAAENSNEGLEVVSVKIEIRESSTTAPAVFQDNEVINVVDSQESQ